MITPLLVTLFALSSGTNAVVPPIGLPVDQQPAAAVRLIVDHEQFGPGDPVHVQVETADDGYLIVMRVDGDGRIRVIFPLDPTGDPFVRGGKRYELRGRSETETFRADDLGGAGIVFAALSSDPLSFADFTKSGHWDYEALRVTQIRDDPEAELHRFVRLMSNEGKYSFDVKGYRVVVAETPTGYVASAPEYYGGYDPYCGGGLGYRGRASAGLRMGFGSIGIRDSWYDPFAFSSYGCDGFWLDPYFMYANSPWYAPYYPGQYAPYTVFPYRPRPIPNTHAGERARPRPSLLAPHVGTIGSLTWPAAPSVISAPKPEVSPGDRARPRQNDAVTSAAGAGAAVVPTPPPAQVAPNVRKVNPPLPTTRPRRAPIPAPPTSANGAVPRRVPPPARAAGATASGAVTPTPPPQHPSGPRPVFREPVPTPPSAVRHDPPTVAQRPVYREPVRTPPPPPRQAPPAAAARAPAPAPRVSPPPPPPPPRVTPPPPPPPPPPPAKGGSGG